MCTMGREHDPPATNLYEGPFPHAQGSRMPEVATNASCSRRTIWCDVEKPSQYISSEDMASAANERTPNALINRPLAVFATMPASCGRARTRMWREMA